MPFGISSAPEVFRCQMHELIAGLCGVKVVADDFMVISFGDTIEEAVQDHDRNLEGLLQRCEQQKVRLYTNKIKFIMHEAPFIDHTATKDGLSVDP